MIRNDRVEVTKLTTVITILQVICALALIFTVLMQSSKSAGLSGSIAGGAETFFGKKKGLDEVMSKLSIASACLFLLLTLVLAMI